MTPCAQVATVLVLAQVQALPSHCLPQLPQGAAQTRQPGQLPHPRAPLMNRCPARQPLASLLQSVTAPSVSAARLLHGARRQSPSHATPAHRALAPGQVQVQQRAQVLAQAQVRAQTRAQRRAQRLCHAQSYVKTTLPGCQHRWAPQPQHCRYCHYPASLGYPVTAVTPCRWPPRLTHRYHRQPRRRAAGYFLPLVREQEPASELGLAPVQEQGRAQQHGQVYGQEQHPVQVPVRRRARVEVVP